MHQHKVWVVGMGVVSSLGDLNSIWYGLLAGKSGVAHNHFTTFRRVHESYDPAEDGLENTIAAEVLDFDPLDYMDKKDARRMDPVSQFAMAAAQPAFARSGLRITSELADRTGVFIGTGEGGLSTLEYQYHRLKSGGSRRVSPLLIPMVMPNAAADHVASSYGLHGPSDTYAAACASGIVAIGEAFRKIRNGEIDAAFAGGSEAVITPTCVSGFRNMHALSPRTNNPQCRSRPFDQDRDGFVMGEGAGMLILVSAELGVAQGLVPLAEIVGYGRTRDGHHITEPHPQGIYAIKAVEQALRDARIGTDEVVYINPHGTGTPLNDGCEAAVYRRIFGEERAAKIPISSSKSMLGHAIGAAGAIETVICVLTIMNGRAHSTINLDTVALECEGLDYIRGTPREIPRGAVLNTAFGFGGENAALILAPF